MTTSNPAAARHVGSISNAISCATPKDSPSRKRSGRPALFTFVAVEGVQPTNNAAERALRGPVIYRKLSHGTQSDDGEKFIERVLSTSVTCRLQDRSMFAYMRELLGAHARGDPLPTLT